MIEKLTENDPIPGNAEDSKSMELIHDSNLA